jgi:hypothetical protein
LPSPVPGRETWPALPLPAWSDTYATLHRLTQIAGKIRLARSAWINHSWQVTLYVTATGLTTSVIPYEDRAFQIDFDFVQHGVRIQTSDGRTAGLPLQPQSVAAFYRRLVHEMESLGLRVKIHKKPNEVSDAVPFDEDEAHAAYDPEYANRFWRILLQSDRVFREFRGRFLGKCSPVHFFWGAPDLAVTRFSGRTAPEHPGGVPNLPNEIAKEAYSHEVSSCGFWAGGGPVAFPVFYSYAYPEPPGYKEAAVKPADAAYNKDLGEFLLPYDAVREASNPDAVLLEFLQSTYEAAANLARWDRGALERKR